MEDIAFYCRVKFVRSFRPRPLPSLPTHGPREHPRALIIGPTSGPPDDTIAFDSSWFEPPGSALPRDTWTVSFAFGFQSELGSESAAFTSLRPLEVAWGTASTWPPFESAGIKPHKQKSRDSAIFTALRRPHHWSREGCLTISAVGGAIFSTAGGVTFAEVGGVRLLALGGVTFSVVGSVLGNWKRNFPGSGKRYFLGHRRRFFLRSGRRYVLGRPRRYILGSRRRKVIGNGRRYSLGIRRRSFLESGRRNFLASNRHNFIGSRRRSSVVFSVVGVTFSAAAGVTISAVGGIFPSAPGSIANSAVGDVALSETVGHTFSAAGGDTFSSAGGVTLSTGWRRYHLGSGRCSVTFSAAGSVTCDIFSAAGGDVFSAAGGVTISGVASATFSEAGGVTFSTEGHNVAAKFGGDRRNVSLTVDFSCQNLPVSRTTTLGPSRHTNSTSPVMPTAVFSALLPNSVPSSLFAFGRTEVSTHEGEKKEESGAKRGHCGSDAAGGRVASAADGLRSRLRGRYRHMLQLCSQVASGFSVLRRRSTA